MKFKAFEFFLSSVLKNGKDNEIHLKSRKFSKFETLFVSQLLLLLLLLYWLLINDNSDVNRYRGRDFEMSMMKLHQ